MSGIDFESVLFVINIMITVELLWRLFWLSLEIIVKCKLRRAINSVTRQLRFSKTVSNIDKDERLKYESVRFSTYKQFPNDSPMRATRLAKNGFFYSGYKDHVKCFSCCAEYGKWKENDNPASVHAQISPNCRFVTGCSSNVPLDGKTNDSISAKVEHTGYSSTVSSATNGEKSVHRTHGNVSDQTISGNKRVAFGNGAIDTTKSHGSKKYTDNSFTQSNVKNTSACNVKDTDTKTDITKVSQKATCREDGFESTAGNIRPEPKEKYKTLEARMETFANWPSRSTIEPETLASAGLYYTGYRDIVACFACNVQLRDWEKEDDPYIVHARWFPHCANLLHKKGSVFIERNQSVRPKTVQVNTMNRELFTSSTQEQRQCLVGNGDNGIILGEDSLNAPNGTSEGNERVLCKFCSIAKRNILFKPCGHVDVCETCACVVTKCLTCGVEKTVFHKVFIQ